MGIWEIENHGSFGLKILGISGGGESKCQVFDVDYLTILWHLGWCLRIGPFSSESAQVLSFARHCSRSAMLKQA